MKATQIQTGCHYTAKVNGNLTTVRVDRIATLYGPRRDATLYHVTNIKTGRTTTFRSAAKFREAITARATN